MSHGTIKRWTHHVTATVTRSYDAEKVIKDFGTDDII